MALIASYIRRPIPQNNLYLGEIDLFRSVRPVASELLGSLKAAVDNGEIASPIKLFAPTSAAEHLSDSGSGIALVACRTLEEAIFQTWADVR